MPDHLTRFAGFMAAILKAHLHDADARWTLDTGKMHGPTRKDPHA